MLINWRAHLYSIDYVQASRQHQTTPLSSDLLCKTMNKNKAIPNNSKFSKKYKQNSIQLLYFLKLSVSLSLSQCLKTHTSNIIYLRWWVWTPGFFYRLVIIQAFTEVKLVSNHWFCYVNSRDLFTFFLVQSCMTRSVDVSQQVDFIDHRLKVCNTI